MLAPSFYTLFTLFVLSTSVEYKWVKGKLSHSWQEKRLSRHILKEYEGVHIVTQCAQKCLLYEKCKSYNFLRGSRKCQLNSATHEDFPDDVTDVPHADYFLRDSYSIDKAVLGSCWSAPCGQNGRCVVSSRLSGEAAHLCVCDAGWAGDSCDKKVSSPTWSLWANWSNCTTLCGNGWQTRSRTCQINGKDGDNNKCPGKHHEYQKCTGTKCTKWTQWGAWSICSTINHCGKGIVRRSRSCKSLDSARNNTSTSSDEISCIGHREETTTCSAISCSAPIKFQSGSEYGEGEVFLLNTTSGHWFPVCGVRFDVTAAHIACRHAGFRLAVTGSNKNGSVSEREHILVGLSCSGSESSLTECIHEEPSKTCDPPQTAVVKCVVDGSWGVWSAWSNCTVCGESNQTRTRVCSSPAPTGGGKVCNGADHQVKRCDNQPCPVDGVWLEWSDWSACSVTCSGGTQSRNRTCEGPYHNGQPCAGNRTEQKECNTDHCVFPGEWLEWTAWGLCSVTCGGGTRHRYRQCNMTTHGEHTSECEGEKSQSKDCHKYSCTPVARTCNELQTRGLEDNTVVKLSPDLMSEFDVFCSFAIEDGKVYAVIGHDKMERTHVNGFEARAEYEISLKYNASGDHVRGLVLNSVHCKQFLKWECKSSSIRNPINNDVRMTFWENRNGEERLYWGGSSPQNNMCACGENKTCAKNLSCNCDANDDVWREDSGYLTIKEDLPISAFKAGDTGELKDEEEAYHTIGPLLCSGLKPAVDE